MTSLNRIGITCASHALAAAEYRVLSEVTTVETRKPVYDLMHKAHLNWGLAEAHRRYESPTMAWQLEEQGWQRWREAEALAEQLADADPELLIESVGSTMVE